MDDVTLTVSVRTSQPESELCDKVTDLLGKKYEVVNVEETDRDEDTEE